MVWSGPGTARSRPLGTLLDLLDNLALFINCVASAFSFFQRNLFDSASASDLPESISDSRIAFALSRMHVSSCQISSVQSEG